jgi:hypothetical protein
MVLNSFWKEITTLFSGGIVATGLLYFVIKKYIDHIFQTEFEKYKFNYQRKIHDFGLYSNKRHEIYPELYKQIRRCASEYLQTDKTLKRYNIPDFSDYSVEDVEISIRDRVNEEKVNELLVLFAENKQDGIKEIERQIKYSQLLKQKRLNLDTHDYFLINELYLTKEVGELWEKIFNRIHVLTESYIFDWIYDKPMSFNGSDLGEISDNLDALLEIFKEELSIGDYSSQ